MEDLPDSDALLVAVARYLREVAAPALDGQAGFHARVAANAIEIVRRQRKLGPVAEAAEQARLERLLGESGDLADLNARLCERIAAGDLDETSASLVEHLWLTTLDKLAVDQPGYASFRQATGQDPR